MQSRTRLAVSATCSTMPFGVTEPVPVNGVKVPGRETCEGVTPDPRATPFPGITML